MITAKKIKSGDARRTQKPAAEVVRWGVAESPFGKMFLAESVRGITHLSFYEGEEKAQLDTLRSDSPNSKLVRDDVFSAKMSGRIFSGEYDLPLDIGGTSFQQKVWKALRGVAPGETTTYGAIAAALGMAGASRAVGSAVGANRICYLIPCHRVIRSDGGLGGFRWGAERKRAMLAAETIPR